MNNYTTEQLWQLINTLPLNDQSLLLQHLVGSLATKVNFSGPHAQSLYRGVYNLQYLVAEAIERELNPHG